MPSPSLTRRPCPSSMRAANAAVERWGCLIENAAVSLALTHNPCRVLPQNPDVASIEWTAAWRACVASAVECGASAWATRSRTVWMVPKLMGPGQDRATHSRDHPPPGAGGPDDCPPLSALHRGPYPVAASPGTRACTQRPQAGPQPWCNTQGVTSMALGGRSRTCGVWYGLRRGHRVFPHAHRSGRTARTVVGATSS